MLCSRILHWHLNCLLAEIAHKDGSFLSAISLHLLPLEDVKNVALHGDVDVGVVNFELLKSLLVNARSCCKVLL